MLPPIGIFEICLVVVAAIVFIKPEDWPKFLRKIGRFYGQVHEYMYKLKAYGRETYDQITNLDSPSHKDVDDRDPVNDDDDDDDDDDDIDEEQEAEWERQSERHRIAEKWRRGKARQRQSSEKRRRR